MMIPRISTKLMSLRPEPPKKKTERTAIRVVTDVMIVRVRDSVID